VRVTTRSYDYAGGVPDAAFQITTRLGAPADRVWVWALTEEGINFELRPWLRMTHPKGLTHARAIDQAPLGEPLGRSWILLRGLIPVDYDDLCLAERGPGLRFLEISELGSARRWQHEREVIPLDGDACEITDRLELDLRAPLRVIGGSRIAGRIVRTLFTHRHRRLLERWGMPPGRKPSSPNDA
jgi:ligand-binding SRPBCC domain-containing protein